MTRILVVDDEPEALSGLVELLRGDGFEVAQAANGKQALELMPAFAAHVVLTDLWMPVMNGRQLIQGLRAIGNQVPVIVITARPETDMGDLPSVPVMQKPFDYHELVARLHAVTRNRRATGAPPCEL